MRLGVVIGVLAVLVSGCTSDGPHGRYRTVDACRLVQDRTVETLSAELQSKPYEVTGGPNSLPYDLSVCRLQFGSMPPVATSPAVDGQLPVGVPAYRAISITAYRYNANRTQSAADRAQILLKSLASTNDMITSPHRDLDQVHLRTYDFASVTKGELWALAGNVVLNIAYDMADTNGIPTAATRDDVRNGVLALVRDAASRLTCTSDDERETC